jgi:hypothetical protein
MRGICPEVLDCGSGVLGSEEERDGAVGLDKEEFGSSWMQPGEIVRATAMLPRWRNMRRFQRGDV